MGSHRDVMKLIRPHRGVDEADPGGSLSLRVELVAIETDGLLVVRDRSGREFRCEWVDTGLRVGVPLVPGDRLLVFGPSGGEPGLVLGRIGRYSPECTGQTDVLLCATQSMTLRCGESSIDLRADGKVMIRGEDVLVRAKGTKRIRAGTVSIN